MADFMGYFIRISMQADKNSFNQAKGLMGGVGQAATGLSKTSKLLPPQLQAVGKYLKLAVSAGVGIAAVTAMFSELEMKTVMLSRTLRITATDVAAIKTAALISGVSVDGLTSALANLQKKADRLRLGEVDVGLAKSLGLMNVGYQSFLKMNTNQRMATVFSQAFKIKDKGFASELVRDALGDAGKEMFQYMLMTGKSFDSIINKAQSLVMTTEASKMKAMEYNLELKATRTAFSELGKLFTSSFGAGIIPQLQAVQKIFRENKNTIRDFVKIWGEGLGKTLGVFIRYLTFGATQLAYIYNSLENISKILDLITGKYAFKKAFDVNTSNFDTLVKRIRGMLKAMMLITNPVMLAGAITDDLIKYKTQSHKYRTVAELWSTKNIGGKATDALKKMNPFNMEEGWATKIGVEIASAIKDIFSSWSPWNDTKKDNRIEIGFMIGRKEETIKEYTVKGKYGDYIQFGEEITADYFR